MERIYMDHAATTPVDARVLEAMAPYFSEKYGNASSLHSHGREAKSALEDSRATVAGFLGADPGEIVFTAGGTESNNHALKGVAFANRERGRHIITSPIEHDCVRKSAEWLATQGFEVSVLPVDEHGLVDPAELESIITDDTILVSVMAANNEIGTIQDIPALAGIAHGHGAYFHTDAVQAYGKVPISLSGVDLLSASSHKLYGPKGVGMLFVRRGTRITPLMHGGGHELGRRSGTENVAGIVGFAKATEIASQEMKSEAGRQAKLRDRLIKGILGIPDSALNGHPTKRLPNNVNVWFRYIEGESLVLMLDDAGVGGSTGSACSSHSLEPSHVLTAIGLRPEEAHGSLRLSLGKQNTDAHADRVLDVLPGIVDKLRRMSPLKSRRDVEEMLKYEEAH
ncbi:MAG: cysteine desulfurase NifS [Candidatus Diapherotrites archaeon]|nr:cysteine desulfurase NifS [Candidatus Diapherotrites archaeon]